MTKPRIKWAAWRKQWYCSTSLMRDGFGDTPAAAYADWKSRSEILDRILSRVRAF